MTELFTLLEETIEKQVEERVSNIMEENNNLSAKIQQLENKIIELNSENDLIRKTNKNIDLFKTLIENFKNKMSHTDDTDKKSKLVYELLNVFFIPDFQECTYECPTWLGAVTNFYSNRQIVVELLKELDVKVPTNIESFRLPQDWTEAELNIVFGSMSKHIVCNNCTYSGNLRFWKPFALDTVHSVCHGTTYSEIPWQFLLRNPNLLHEKYLTKIGKMAFEEPYVRGWRDLFNIDKYQTLTDEQLNMIIKNIDAVKFEGKDDSVPEFLLRHIELVEDELLLDKLYSMYKDAYKFTTNKTILKFPMKYIEDYVRNKENPFDWIKTNENLFTPEQRKHLLEVAVKSVLQV